jgi:hypothetical protein
MIAYLVLRIVLLVVGIALVVRVWRASAVHAILSMIIPGYVIVPLVKYWKEPDHDIRWHVALLFTCAMTVVWLQYKLAREYQAEQTQLQAQLLADDEDDAVDSAESTASITPFPADETQEAAAALAAVRQTHPLMSGRKAPLAASTPAPPEPRTLAPKTQESAETKPEVPLTFARAAAEAKFTRGKFELASMGFALGLPDHFRAFGGVDARRIETSLGQPTDAHEIAWVMHENVPISGAGSWHVRVRWLADGWVAPPVSTDGEGLLHLAQQLRAVPRLAGSGGELLGYAVAPTLEPGFADWVEERLPDGSGTSVLDCHAVRLGHNGVLEFSIVGAPAGSQALCDASVRLLARRAQMQRGAAYSVQAETGAARAPYSLEQLVAQH